MEKTVKSRLQSKRMQRTALVVALTGAFGYASETSGQTTVDSAQDISSQTVNGALNVVSGGVLTGDSSIISGGAYDLLKIGAGGQAVLDNLMITNNLDSPTGQNGRAVLATGAGASATLNNATISVSAYSTNNGTDYAHAFTAGVGASGGGNVRLNGGTVSVEGSKRTVGLQANDGGSIDAVGVQVTTGNHFGHAIVAYRTPNDPEQPTRITLDGVSVETLGDSYAVGIQAANKGAAVEAQDTSITTHGAGSFGAEVFNGATLSYLGGDIQTEGVGAAGIRAYGGSLGAGQVSLRNTTISTTGAGAAGVVAGDSSEPIAGEITLQSVSIATQGDSASGLVSAYGSTVDSTGSSITTQGANAHGATAQNGGSLTLNGDTFVVNGNQAYGMLADGLNSSIVATGVAVETNGLYGYGARAQAGGSIAISGGSISTANTKGRDAQDGDGSRAYALTADGAGSTISVANGTAISTQGQRAYGAYATNGGEITLQDASVQTNGFMAYGLYASGAGSTVDASNVVVRTSGSVGDAIWAYQGGLVTLNGANIDVAGNPNANSPYETANGLVAVGGTQGVGNGTISARNMTLVTHGADSVGAKVGGAVGDSLTSGTVELYDSSVTVKGDRAVAAEVNYGSSFQAQNSTLISKKGDGIVINDSGVVNLVNTRLESAGASLVSNLNSAEQVQQIVLGSGTEATRNNGVLLQVNRNEAGMDGIVNLTLSAGSSAYGDVVDLDGLSESGSRAGITNFTVEAGANWSGLVRGINDATTEAGGQFVDNGGAPISGNVSGAQNATIVFNNGATIGGGVSVAEGGQAVFHGNTSVAGNVVNTGATMSFSGPTTLQSNVAASGGAQMTFQGPLVIGQSVSGSTGAAFVFQGTAQIVGGVSGDGSNFLFSKTEGSTIGGDVALSNSATLAGGSVGAPIVVQGNVTASSGSVLGGNLSVRGDVNAAGATLSPGNSIGVQTYGSISNFGSTYKAEVNAAGASDLIRASTGNVDISATNLIVAQENGNGGYRLGHDYRILQTVGGNVVGTFASSGLDSSFANTLVRLDPVKYGSKDVFVSLSVDQSKVAAVRQGLTSNQSHTLDGALSVAGMNSAADAAFVSSSPASALNQLSGEIHASTQSALLQSTSLVQRAVLGRAGTSPAQGSPLWAQVLGGEYRLGADGAGAASAKTRQGGLLVGGDVEISDGWRVGGALGYVDGKTTVDDRSSHANTESYTAALYGGKRWNLGGNSMNLRVGAAYTHHKVDSTRHIDLAGGQSLKADYSVNSMQLFSELGYDVQVNDDTRVGPYAQLAWTSQRAGAFQESGGSGALKGESQRDGVLTSSLGLRGATSFTLYKQPAALRGSLAWVHAAGDVDQRRSLAFIQGQGSNFQISGVPLARDTAALELAAEVKAGEATSFGVGYGGQFGSGLSSHAASLYLQTRF